MCTHPKDTAPNGFSCTNVKLYGDLNQKVLFVVLLKCCVGGLREGKPREMKIALNNQEPPIRISDCLLYIHTY